MAQSALRDISPTWWKDIKPQAPQKPAGQQMSDVLGGMALATAPIPIVGDVAGAVSDAAMYAAYPEERTMLNAGMSLAGLLPFVPGAGGVRAAEKAADALRDAPSVSLMDDGKGKAFIMSDGKQAGIIEYEINDGAVQIKGSEVTPSRSGIGTEAYKQFINSKMDEGFSVGSDNIVSQQAEGLYQKLSSQGYEIAENPNNRRIYPGSLTSVSRDSMRSQRSAHPTEYRDGAIQSAPGFVLRGDPVYQITRRPQDAPLPSPLEGTLDMSQAARMQRAAEQGFNVDMPVYHGTAVDFKQFDPDRSFGSQFWSTTDKAAIEAGEVGAAGRGVIKEMYQRIKNPAGWAEYDKYSTDELIAKGYDGLALPDADGQITYVAFDPSQYRDVKAAFDPAKRDSRNLMAGATGATIGLSALRNINQQEEK